MMNGLLLTAGFAVLVVTANSMVTSASTLAQQFGISSWLVGLTVLSLATSMPEMVVTLVSGMRNHPDLAIANVLGSNVANILLVLGLAALIRPIPVRNKAITADLCVSLLAALLVALLANTALLSGDSTPSISSSEGFILLICFLLYITYTFTNGQNASGEPTRRNSRKDWLRPILMLVIMGIGMYWGGLWVVDGAVAVAHHWGIESASIGLTIVALGTSAPELMASTIAAYRGQTDMAVGNVIGSNIFNLLWVLGLTSSVIALPFTAINDIDFAVLISSSVLIILITLSSRRGQIGRVPGSFFVLFYFAYFIQVVVRA